MCSDKHVKKIIIQIGED